MSELGELHRRVARSQFLCAAPAPILVLGKARDLNARKQAFASGRLGSKGVR
jgi:hypothetical protein